MADVAVKSSTHSGVNDHSNCQGPYWRSQSVGYVLFRDDDNGIKCAKTDDSGATWAIQDDINSPISGGSGDDANIRAFASWASWNTPSITNDRIYVVLFRAFNDDLWLFTFDTGTDTWTQLDEIVASGFGDNQEHSLAITVARSGRIYVACHCYNGTSEDVYSAYTDNEGTAWTDIAEPWEGDQGDRMLLFPGFAADDNDIIGVFFDASATEVSRKNYDATGDSWAETSIDSGITDPTTVIYGAAHMKGAVDHFRDRIIVAVASEEDSATGDLRVWSIDESNIDAKTNIITNSDDWWYPAPFVDPSNGDIYVAYAGASGGAQTHHATVDLHYQKSDDNGSTWGGEQTYSTGTADDIRIVDAGCSNPASGGRFMPAWFNDDLNNIYVNDGNDIAINQVGATDPDLHSMQNWLLPFRSAIGFVPGTSTAAQNRQAVMWHYTGIAGAAPGGTTRRYSLPLTGVG